MQELSAIDVKKALGPFQIERQALDAIVIMILLHAKTRPAVESVATVSTISEVARSFHRSSLKRQHFVGKAADDPGWNMLLAIFADQTEDVPISVSSACHASGGASTTALRHLSALHESGILTRTPDPFDGRRAHVSLSAGAYSQMAKLIHSFCLKMPS